MRAIKYPTSNFNLVVALDKTHKPAQCLNAMTPTNYSLRWNICNNCVGMFDPQDTDKRAKQSK